MKEYIKIKEELNTADFKDNEENITKLVQETISFVERKEETSLIRKSLCVIKELAVGAGSSLIATGIAALLTTIL